MQFWRNNLDHRFIYGTSNSFQHDQWPSAQNIKSFELCGYWLAICINHFVNWTMKIWRTYEKRKMHTFGKGFFITATLGPWSGYHILIWNRRADL